MHAYQSGLTMARGAVSQPRRWLGAVVTVLVFCGNLPIAYAAEGALAVDGAAERSLAGQWARQVTVQVAEGMMLLPVSIESRHEYMLGLTTRPTPMLGTKGIRQGVREGVLSRHSREAGASARATYMADSLTIAGYRRENVMVMEDGGADDLAADLGAIALHGYVPFHFFSPGVLQLSYDTQSLWITERAEQLDLQGAVRPEARVWRQGMLVRVRLNGLPAEEFALLPSEPSTVMLTSREYAQKVLASCPVDRRQVVEINPGEKQTILRLGTLEIAGVTIQDPLCTVRGEGGLGGVVGVLGGRFFERFTTTIDMENRSVWLRPGKKFAVREEHDMSGIFLTRAPSDFMIVHVAPGSPGAAAGLGATDHIVSLDGRPFYRWTLDEMRERLRGPDGEKVPLRVRRGDRELDATLVLKRRI